MSFWNLFQQSGGGNCSCCGSTGVTKATCPLNPKAKNKNPAKHPKAKGKKVCGENGVLTATKQQKQQKQSVVKKSPVISFKPGIAKVLKLVHPDTDITGGAENAINRMINEVGLRLIKAGVTEDARYETAITSVIPGDLAKHSQSEGNRAVTVFNMGNHTGKLFFSIPTVVKLIKRHGKNGGAGVNKIYHVYLGAILEYLSAELLELAGNQARDDSYAKGLKRPLINEARLYKAIKADTELSKLFG